jgi:pilus assembly protein Flp/PilA
MDLLKNLWNDESGQGLTEYGVIIAIVSVALVVLLTAFSGELGRIFNGAIDELESAGPVQQAQT